LPVAWHAVDLRVLADPEEEHRKEKCEDQQYAADEADDDEQVVTLFGGKLGRLDLGHTLHFAERTRKDKPNIPSSFPVSREGRAGTGAIKDGNGNDSSCNLDDFTRAEAGACDLGSVMDASDERIERIVMKRVRRARESSIHIRDKKTLRPVA
jgi:hypothetical protein